MLIRNFNEYIKGFNLLYSSTNNPQMVYADLEIAGSHSADKATTQTVGHEM